MSKTVIGFERVAFEQRLSALEASKLRVEAAIDETKFWLRIWDNQVANEVAAPPSPIQEEMDGSGTLPS